MGDHGECHKYHKHLDGNTDGCQKFLPNAISLNSCAACHCHRNFHRKVEEPAQRPNVELVPTRGSASRVKIEAPTKNRTEVVYTKCHRIHEFKFGYSLDGCQEFNPGGGDICAACGCHKGFHRNEVTKEEVT